MVQIGVTGRCIVTPASSTRSGARTITRPVSSKPNARYSGSPGSVDFDVDAIRSDIREDREGTLLRLGVRVREAAGCEPIENAIVDVRLATRPPLCVQRAADPSPPNSAEAPRDDHALILDVDIDARAVANGTDDQFDQLLGCKAAGLQAHRGKAHGLAAA